MACQKQENHYGASTEVYLYFNYRSPAFVLLVELNEKPLHFKFEVNRLNPLGAMAEKQTDNIMQISCNVKQPIRLRYHLCVALSQRRFMLQSRNSPRMLPGTMSPGLPSDIVIGLRSRDLWLSQNGMSQTGKTLLGFNRSLSVLQLQVSSFRTTCRTWRETPAFQIWSQSVKSPGSYGGKTNRQYYAN